MHETFAFMLIAPERAFCREPGVCVCLDGNGGDDCTIGMSLCLCSDKSDVLS